MSMLDPRIMNLGRKKFCFEENDSAENNLEMICLTYSIVISCGYNPEFSSVDKMPKGLHVELQEWIMKLGTWEKNSGLSELGIRMT